MSDDWDFYFCQIDDRPASLFVDLGLHCSAPIAELSDMAWLSLQLLHPGPDGLTGNEEFDRLNEIEDALAATDVGDTQLVYVGRSTSGGHRDFLFYTTNGLKAESRLSAAMVAYPEYGFEVGSRPDADWSVYLEFLYPSDRQRQMILNGRVLQTLEESGDQHQIEREVCHWIYFDSQDDRTRFAAEAANKGYKLTDMSDQDGKHGAQLTGVTAVDYSTINTIVLELFDLATKFSGEYDGWETSVEKA